MSWYRQECLPWEVQSGSVLLRQTLGREAAVVGRHAPCCTQIATYGHRTGGTETRRISCWERERMSESDSLRSFALHRLRGLALLSITAMSVTRAAFHPTITRCFFSLSLAVYPCIPTQKYVKTYKKGGSDGGFDFLSRRRPGMQDRGGVRVRRRMDKSRTVPTDQQPFNELQELKEDPLFGWAQEDFRVSSESGAIWFASFPS